LVTTLENQINSRLGFQAFGFGVVFSALMVGRLVFQVPLGRLSDRLGRKPLVVGGLILMAPATALLGETSSSLLFGIERFVQGIGAAAIVAPALAYAGDLAHMESECRRSRMMSLVTIGFGLGIAFGPLMAGTLGIISYRLPFLVDGALCLAGAVVVFLFMGETVERKPFRRRGYSRSR
jgi:MFS family permease